ncbi:MAG: hypothetical protein IJ335_12690 [Lachnospiraceae bacterium]|nr:hypothetical protein [Lachnospiraceae bacterium]
MRRKKITKTLALLLASAMCLTACGSTKVTTPTGTGTSEQDSQVSVETSQVPEKKNYWEMLDEVSDTSELPDWEGEKLEVSIWIGSGTDALIDPISESNVVLKEIERVTGIVFNEEETYGNGGDTIDAKMPKLIASGNLPTLVYGYNIGSQLNELYDNGYLYDLTEYYQNGSLDHLTYWYPLEEMDQILYKNLKAEDGSYFLIPGMTAKNAASYWDASGYYPEEYDPSYWNTYAASPLCAVGEKSFYSICVRDDILKKLYPDAYSAADLTKIYMEEGTFTEEQIYDVKLESADEFYDMLRDIKELLKDEEFVGLDGRPMEVTYGPHTGTDNWGWMTILARLLKGFTTTTDYFVTSDRSEDSEGLLQYSYETEKYIDYMKELNVLVNEDIFAQNSLVDNAAAYQEKYLNGHYAVVYGNNNPIATWVDGSAGGWTYRPVWVNVPVDEDFGGYGGLSQLTYYGIFKNEDMTDEKLEQLIHFIDYQNSEVGIKNTVWGPKSAGLFEEDADGNRKYVNAELEENVVKGNAESQISVELGIYSDPTPNKPYNIYPKGAGVGLYEYKYLNAPNSERNEKDALTYFTPGILEGKSEGENCIRLSKGCQVYDLGMKVESIKQFWSARAGFESQMKKVIVAAPDKFDTELENLVQYSQENGLTEDTLKEFTDLFIETNKEALKAAGVIE